MLQINNLIHVLPLLRIRNLRIVRHTSSAQIRLTWRGKLSSFWLLQTSSCFANPSQYHTAFVTIIC